MKNTLKLLTSFVLATLITACACSSCAPAPNFDEILSPQESEFFSLIQSMCGKTFVGESVYPEDPGHDFAGKKLVATIDYCDNQHIAIPFTVGEDESRTWHLNKTYQGLLFKHEHRLKDGSPDPVTNYGGYSASYKGEAVTATKHFFHADDFTAELIPDAKTNVWMLEVDPENQELTYYLERHGKPRYKAVLQLKE
ncbi:hypothetical protein GCM10009123_01090 [Kangiella japonica]|uniref:Lipoprotein n=1 Tax=Kangiella japonica TaxID=647384 RepID=A0ABN0ST90_9GAMM